MDRTIVAAWRRLGRDRCARCGRPREVHKTDRVEDYKFAHYTCTAALAEDRWHTLWRKVSSLLPRPAFEQAKADQKQRDDGFNPDAARVWFGYTDAEGIPFN